MNWLGLRTGLNAVEERKNILLLPGIEHRFIGRESHSLVSVLTEL
jgi:hypothetical protein